MPIVNGEVTSCGDCSGYEKTCRCCPYGVDEKTGIAKKYSHCYEKGNEKMSGLIRDMQQEQEDSLNAYDYVDSYKEQVMNYENRYNSDVVCKYLVYTRGEYADGYYITYTLKNAADYLNDFYITGRMKEGWIKSLTHREYMEMRI